LHEKDLDPSVQGSSNRGPIVGRRLPGALAREHEADALRDAGPGLFKPISQSVANSLRPPETESGVVRRPSADVCMAHDANEPDWPAPTPARDHVSHDMLDLPQMIGPKHNPIELETIEHPDRPRAHH
jgi:hypothetical protein